MSRPKILQLRADTLEPHPTAQRMKLVPANLRRISEKFNPRALGTIHVVQLDEKNYIVDGMHRWTAVMDRGLGDMNLTCEVHTEVTDHVAASKLFLQLNDRATMDQFSKWENELAAGDPETTEIAEIVERYGLKVSQFKKDGLVSCPAALHRVYRFDATGVALDNALDVLTSAYGRVAAGTEAKLIEGTALVLDRFNGDIEREALVRRLAKYPGGANSLVGNAKGLARLRRLTHPKAVAELVLDAYNAGRRGGGRLSL